MIFLSPSKTLDFSDNFTPPWQLLTQSPSFLSESTSLVEILKKYDVSKIANKMKISEKLAKLNHKRYREWQIDHNFHNSKPAIYTFQGDVYRGLDVLNLNEKSLLFLQDYLFILSGLYGFLKPMDRIHPYRLEMGIENITPNIKTLAHFLARKNNSFHSREKTNDHCQPRIQ